MKILKLFGLFVLGFTFGTATVHCVIAMNHALAAAKERCQIHYHTDCRATTQGWQPVIQYYRGQ